MPQLADLEIAFPARPENSQNFRRALRTFLEALPLGNDRVDDVILAAGEAAGNAIEHAYAGGEGSVRLRARVAARKLIVEIDDNGRWRLDGDPERGRGLAIMRALVDRVSIESSRAGTSVRLEVAL